MVNSSKDNQSFIYDMKEHLDVRSFNFIQQKFPTSISGEMNVSFYQFSRGSNPD
jgi:hypothetical protein